MRCDCLLRSSENALPVVRVDDVKTHECCNEDYNVACPARLLDLVRFWSSGDVVLVELDEETMPYTTLSHC